MSNLLVILYAEGASSGQDGDGPDAPEFPPSWDEFVVARRRFLDQLSRSSPGTPGPTERTNPSS